MTYNYSFTPDSYMRDALLKRERDGRRRALRLSRALVDFCSNDYLGFARSLELGRELAGRFDSSAPSGLGSTGSRLISGQSALFEKLETKIAAFHRAEAALIFNSGYDANLGLLACLPQRGDTVIYDELCHASLRDGTRLSFAAAFGFRHNCMQALRAKLGRANGRTFVVVESLYSMDGDFAPMAELVPLCREFGAALIVDEAHASGVCGPMGEGRVVEMGAERGVFARVHTFGKALGTHGAAVLGSALLKDYLVNFCRPFIYTTALPPHSLESIDAAYDRLPRSESARSDLCRLIRVFKDRSQSFRGALLPSESAIQSVVIPGNDRVRAASEYLQSCGFDVRAILSPTVPKDKERLRICLHAFNSEDEVGSLCDRITSFFAGAPAF